MIIEKLRAEVTTGNQAVVRYDLQSVNSNVNVKCKCQCTSIAHFCSEPAVTLRLCSKLNEITQFYLPSTRFLPARAEQDLEHYICKEILDAAAPFTDLGSLIQAIPTMSHY
jgi:hypothetical protein